MSSSSFAVAINVFDDTVELLESLLLNLKMIGIDFVIVLWQELSYHGEPSRVDWNTLMASFKEKNLFHQDACFHPTIRIGIKSDSVASQNEVAKRNLGLQLSKKLNATYYMTLDADEFFLLDEMKHVMEHLNANPSVDATMCTYANYYKTFDFIMKQNPNRHIWVPLFYKIKPSSRFILDAKRPRNTDPTRIVMPSSRWKIFHPNEIICHHAAYIRSERTMNLKCHHRTNRNAHNRAHTQTALKAFKEFQPNQLHSESNRINLLAWNGPATLIRVEPVFVLSKEESTDSYQAKYTKTPETVQKLVTSFYFHPQRKPAIKSIRPSHHSRKGNNNFWLGKIGQKK